MLNARLKRNPTFLQRHANIAPTLMAFVYYFTGNFKMADTRKKKAIAAIVISLLLRREERVPRLKKRKTREWIKKRVEKGLYANLILELSSDDPLGFREMMRMSREQCHEILEKIEPYISKQATVMGGHPISAGERLALTLRFLATGESFRSLHFQFRISRRAVSYIVYEVCKAIHDVLGAVYLKVPSTTQEWSRIACQFEERWNFPNCLGAVDGKHIVMQPPAGAGSHFYNYKHTHSVVLMAVAGPAYEILYADVGGISAPY